MALENVAQTLIAQNGRPVILVRRNTVPNAEPWLGGSDQFTRTTVSAVFVNDDAPQQSPTNVGGRTGTFLIAGLDATGITTDDSIEDGADVWQVTNAARVEPGSLNYLWKVSVAK